MKQGVKIGIIVVALVGAGVSYYVFGGAKEQAAQTADETKTLWMCQACNDSAEISAKGVLDLVTRSGGSTAPYICPKCNEKKLFRALKCEKCSSIYFAPGVPDAKGVCSTCNPDYVPPPPKTEDEEVEVAPEEQEGSEKPGIAPVRKVRKPKAA